MNFTIKPGQLLFILMIIVALGCQPDVSRKEKEAKADSLENQTQRKMDSAEESILKHINDVDDSTILKDSINGEDR